MTRNPNIIAFVQARMGSTRLKGKVLKKVNGQELLLFLVKRIRKARTISDVVVITTTGVNDDVIADFCKEHKINYYRGSEFDLLDRHYKAAKKYKADFVVKIPSDSPFSDPNIIDRVINLWKKNQDRYDYVSNYHPPTFPDGLDVEGCSLRVLQIAWREAKKDFEREHTFPFIWDNPERFRIGNVINRHGDMFLKYRWTMDYEADFAFIEAVIKQFKNNPYFTMEDVLGLLKRKPEIAKINSKYLGVNWYKNAQGRLKTVDRHLFKTIQDLKLDKSLELLKRARKVIPCATQTLSKGYTQWSVGAVPLFIASAKGCEVCDVDGNTYIDYGMALGPFILGYADEDINKAVSRQLDKGTMFTLPHPIEIEAAEKIIENVPCAEMVRFGKNGSDATAAAVKLARAYTGREKVIVCGYHGWQDWYIASTERSAGVPACLKELVISVKYNDIKGLEQVFAGNRHQIAAMIMEPVGAVKPVDNYLQKVRRLTEKNKSLLIFDELFSGFRWSMGGAQQYFNVTPDLACFGKAMANGFPISCVAGKKRIMKIFEDVFFSFTYGGETLSLAATVATINKLKTRNVHGHIEKLGAYIIDGVNRIISKHGLKDYVSIIGYPFKSVFMFSGDSNCTPLEIKTFLQQECAARGVLFIGYHLVSYAHKKEHIDFTLNVYDEVMSELRKVLSDNKLKSSLRGATVTQIFKNVGDRSG